MSVYKRGKVWWIGYRDPYGNSLNLCGSPPHSATPRYKPTPGPKDPDRGYFFPFQQQA